MAAGVSSKVEFRPASHCGNSTCVEVAPLGGGGVAVRDSKDHGEGPVLVFTDAEWVAFLSGARAGEFDFGLIPSS